MMILATTSRTGAADGEPAYGAPDQLAPVHLEDDRPVREGWSARLLLFLRVTAVMMLFKGLHHWWVVCGFGASAADGFDSRSLPWQTATVFFAVIDLVAAVGLWLAAPWGALVWLTAAVTMIVVQGFFPAIYGFQLPVVAWLVTMIVGYLVLAVLAAREQHR